MIEVPDEVAAYVSGFTGEDWMRIVDGERRARAVAAIADDGTKWPDDEEAARTFRELCEQS